ncbi:MAG: coniferyl aldehyde dehydrogenase [Alphaproteobacteria bacterium]|nr:coniferyl aldehyde dehydrogenase [Rhodobiaceae bacterium]MBO6541958.1 coniferyl aldehyde dehydrogenase [Alphaproteobacteria bacterium]MBO6628128.1 coniferyl aldehyde dehydrogenase [Alphaproteobacteria bacterium]MDF1625186.1 coniferyl aldehyde dehydrogenase [Parvibaculaceae bacterium]
MSVAEENRSEDSASAGAAIREIVERQRAAHIREGAPSAERRIEWIDRAIALLVDNQKEIAEAMASDFGHRSIEQSLLTDIMGSIGPLKHAKKHLRNWMKPEKRKVMFPLGLFGAKARIEYQPKGVVGVISPWNFPINLTFVPLAGIFAAGNRAIIKPSEFTPATSELMARMFREAYDETEVAVVTGGPAVGEAFSRQPFDHLLFTGATSIAYHVMRAAAENLVPLTLELGGKSPVIVSKSAPIEEAAAKIMTGKTMNAGQICLAPDYVFVPESKVDAFVDAAQKSVKKMYPTIKDNPDYTSIVNQRHFDRLNSYVDDARAKGAKIVEINPANEDFSQQPHHKIAPTLVLNPTEDMKIMQDEIFGPLLPVKTYKDADDTIDYINANDRPLGLYYFGEDKAEENKVLTKTTSGGVTVNDVIMHVSMEDLPFGGVGPSGMGAYHGVDGFKEFSHPKAIYTQAKAKMVAEMFRPPYGAATRKRLASQIKK